MRVKRINSIRIAYEKMRTHIVCAWSCVNVNASNSLLCFLKPNLKTEMRIKRRNSIRTESWEHKGIYSLCMMLVFSFSVNTNASNSLLFILKSNLQWNWNNRNIDHALNQQRSSKHKRECSLFMTQILSFLVLMLTSLITSSASWI